MGMESAPFHRLITRQNLVTSLGGRHTITKYIEATGMGASIPLWYDDLHAVCTVTFRHDSIHYKVNNELQ